MPTRASTPGVGRAATAGLLAVAVLAISSSAVLVRWADASPVALAFWRTAGGAIILAGPSLRHRVRPQRHQWRWLAVTGVALAVHFAAWLASLELTTVAASVTLVTTAPLVIALYQLIRGRSVGSGTWAAIGLAMVGTLIITGRDLGTGETDALLGDGLALLGAVAMAVYLVVGQRLRADLPTSTYASRTYAVAASVLLPALLVARADLWGYDATTWAAIGAMIVGPQLAGHTALNLLLKRLGSVTVSLALLAEPVGATLLAWLFLAELPPVAAVIGAPLILAALALQITARSDPEAPASES